MFADRTGLPDDAHPDDAGLAFLVERDFAHDKAQHLLALLRRGSLPHVPEIARQAENLGALRVAGYDTRLFRSPGSVSLLDGFELTQLLLPRLFERAGNQPVLRFHGIVLPAGPLAPEPPLVFERALLLFELAHLGARQCDLVGRQRVQQYPLELSINTERPHFLTTRLTSKALVGATLVKRVIPVRTGVAHGHAPAATGTHCNPLQQSAPLTWCARPASRVGGDVVGEAGLVGHELLPANVTRMGITQADCPLLDGNLDRGASPGSSAPSGRIAPPTAIGVGASLSRVVQDVQHAAAVGEHPDHLMRHGPAQRTDGQRQAVPSEFAHDRLGALQLAEFVEHEPESGLHLLIWVECNAAATVPNEPGRQWQPQLATCRFLALTLVEPHSDLMQFRLAHDPGQTQQEPIVVSRWIV